MDRAEPIVPVHLEAIPDFLGKAARINSVASLLQAAQDQLLRLEGQMVVNGDEESAPIPGSESGETYGHRMEAIRTGVAELWAQSGDIREELIAEAVKRRDLVEKQIKKRAEEV